MERKDSYKNKTIIWPAMAHVVMSMMGRSFLQSKNKTNNHPVRCGIGREKQEKNLGSHNLNEKSKTIKSTCQNQPGLCAKVQEKF